MWASALFFRWQRLPYGSGASTRLAKLTRPWALGAWDGSSACPPGLGMTLAHMGIGVFILAQW
jgi:hypothetical protein